RRAGVGARVGNQGCSPRVIGHQLAPKGHPPEGVHIGFVIPKRADHVNVEAVVARSGCTAIATKSYSTASVGVPPSCIASGRSLGWSSRGAIHLANWERASSGRRAMVLAP